MEGEAIIKMRGNSVGQCVTTTGQTLACSLQRCTEEDIGQCVTTILPVTHLSEMPVVVVVVVASSARHR